jgi:hypothetical protein
MNKLALIPFVALALAGCGTATSVASTPPVATQHPAATATAIPTPLPTATAIPTPRPTATPAPIAATGGAGDTAANPDSGGYNCAAAGNVTKGFIIAYTTVSADSDDADAQTLCSTLETSSYWTAVTSIAPGSYYATAVCYVTTYSGQVTVRVYTALEGNAGTTATLCNSMLQGFSLPTLPSS